MSHGGGAGTQGTASEASWRPGDDRGHQAAHRDNQAYLGTAWTQDWLNRQEPGALGRRGAVRREENLKQQRQHKGT